jgi:hypothetical protein
MGDLSFLNSKKNFSKHPCFPEISLFSQEDLPILKFKNWPIFMGDLSFSNSKQNSNKRSCFPEIGLFHRQSVHFEIQKFAYFHERHVLFKLKKKKELQQVSLLP